MPFLTGPNVPTIVAMAQLARGHRNEPFGPFEGMRKRGMKGSTSAVEAALMQLAGLMSRFMGIIEILAKKPKKRELDDDEDDFMNGWGNGWGKDSELEG